MARYCEEGCQAVCDFCKNYKDAGEDGKPFEGEGICLAKSKIVFAEDGCEDDFVCFRLMDD